MKKGKLPKLSPTESELAILNVMEVGDVTVETANLNRFENTTKIFVDITKQFV